MTGSAGAQGRTVAAIVEPGAHAECGAEQRRSVAACRQRRGGALDRLRLGRVGPGEPAPQLEGMAGRLEDRSALDDRRGAVHPEAHPFDHRGEMPGVDRAPVASGVPADRLEPDPPQPGGGERMAGEERVEAGDRAAACSRAAESAANRSKIPGVAPIGSPRAAVPTDADSAVIEAASDARSPRAADAGDRHAARAKASRTSPKTTRSRDLAGWSARRGRRWHDVSLPLSA